MVGLLSPPQQLWMLDWWEKERRRSSSQSCREKGQEMSTCRRKGWLSTIKSYLWLEAGLWGDLRSSQTPTEVIKIKQSIQTSKELALVTLARKLTQALWRKEALQWVQTTSKGDETLRTHSRQGKDQIQWSRVVVEALPIIRWCTTTSIIPLRNPDFELTPSSL